MKWIKYFFLINVSFVFIINITNCTRPSASSSGSIFIDASDSLFSYIGRIDVSNPKAVRFSFPGTSITFKTNSTSCVLRMKNKSIGKGKDGLVYKNYFIVVIDSKKPQTYSLSNEDSKISLKNLGNGIHTITIFKKTESLVGECIFEGVEIDKGSSLLSIAERNTRKIEFIGNSITCGYGNEGKSKDCSFSPETENGYLAYGAITARKLSADYVAVAYSGRGMYRNYDGSVENTMSIIYDKIIPDDPNSPKFNYKNWSPDIIVINLGTNDFAKGIPDSMIFVNTYSNFLKRMHNYYPNAILLCTLGPMVNDSYPKGDFALTKAKNYIIASSNRLIKAGDNKVFTFFYTPQGEGDYGCDWHPNLAKHEKMAAELIKEIKFRMKW